MPLYPQLAYGDPDTLNKTSDVQEYDGVGLTIDSSGATLSSSDNLNGVIKKLVNDGLNNVNTKVNNLATSDFDYDGSSGNYITSGNALNNELGNLDSNIKSNNDSINNLDGSNLDFTGSSGNYITSGDTINKTLENLDSNVASGNADKQDIYDNADLYVDDHVSTGLSLSSTSGVDVTYNSGSYYVNGKRVDISQTSKTLSTSSDNYTYLKDDGSIQIKTTSIGAGAPSTDSDATELYKHETDATSVVSSTDRRKNYPFSGSDLKDDSISLRHLPTSIEGRLNPTSPSSGNYARYDGSSWKNVGASQIKTDYESNSDTNAFTDSEETKLAGIETGATQDQTPVEIRDALQSLNTINRFDINSVLKPIDLIDNASSPHTLDTTSDYFISCDTSGGSVTIDLPSPGTAPPNNIYIISDARDNAATNPIAIKDSGGATIHEITTNGRQIFLRDSGTSWEKI